MLEQKKGQEEKEEVSFQLKFAPLEEWPAGYFFCLAAEMVLWYYIPAMRDDGNEQYQRKLEDREDGYEALCRRCGECCGASGSDPCARLSPSGDGRFVCTAYASRLGPQMTRSGVIFTCVTIRDVHKHGVYYNNCAYSTGSK